MIFGIGIDLLNVERIEVLILKFGESKLVNKLLSIEEAIEYKTIHKDFANFFGKKFSAKEAFSKALGTGIGRGINFNDITVSSDILGKPIIILSDTAVEFIENYYKESIDNIQINVSITDEKPFINTVVIISKD